MYWTTGGDLTLESTDQATRLMNRRLAAALLATAVWVGSCGPDFAPYWRVNKFRVLAVKATPVTLQEGDTATLSALAYDPAGEPIDYRWEWCPFRVSAQSHYECPVDVDDVNALIARQGQTTHGEKTSEYPDDFFDLGAGQTAQFNYPDSRQRVAGFCRDIIEAAVQAGPDSVLGSKLGGLDCSESFEVSIRLVASTADDEIIARKRIELATAARPTVNLNPAVTGMRIRPKRATDAAKIRSTLGWVDSFDGAPRAGWQRLPADGATPIVAGIPFNTQAVVDATSVETWQPPAPEGSDRELLPPESEAFVFRTFTSAGDLDDTRGLYVPGQNTLQSASEGVLNIPYDPGQPDADGDGIANDADNCAPLYNPTQTDANGDGIGDGCDVYLWTVVRDGRLGLDYVQRKVRVVQW